VLVRAQEPVEVDAKVEIRVALPGAQPAGEPPEVACLGRVVRTGPHSENDPWVTYAVEIDQYDFLPAPEGPPDRPIH
jgi:hypothetical protein